MKHVYNDGGRKDAGYKGLTGDCATRAIAIATGKSYQEVYDEINHLAKFEYTTKGTLHRSSARTGVHKRTIRAYMKQLGYTWTPTMFIGKGTTVHLREGELPRGRLVVLVSRHYCAVIDGVIHDTYDPSREGTRCVYGYFNKA